MSGIRQRLSRLKRLLHGGPHFATRDVKIGRNVRFGDNVYFRCGRVRIGDGVTIGSNVIVESSVFELGDYATIYDDCFFPGPGTLRIGHNLWLGKGAIIDCQGGTSIGDNVGIGAGSQLWTHMKYGDVMAGCRFHSNGPLAIEEDVWLVGHCLVSPVQIGARSLAMLGSVVTRDMKADHCYAGAPARDVSEKFGTQFAPSSWQQRLEYMESRLEELSRRPELAGLTGSVRLVSRREDMAGSDKDVTVFNVADRSYTKCGSELEYRLMRALLPDAKFTPASR